MQRYDTAVKFPFAILHCFMRARSMDTKKPSMAFIRDCTAVHKQIQPLQLYLTTQTSPITFQFYEQYSLYYYLYETL